MSVFSSLDQAPLLLDVLGCTGRSSQKIDRSVDGRCLVLHLIGRIESEPLEQLKSEMEDSLAIALDLQDVKLVDRDAVHFLAACETGGAELRNCSPYIREWIAKEKQTPETE